MEENNIIDMIQQPDMTSNVEDDRDELREQIRVLRSDNKLLSETVIRLAMKSVGVL